jgi:AcrR family transcriptional regulator
MAKRAAGPDGREGPRARGALRAEHGAATRERLLCAAEGLFAAKGFAATSVRDITAHAGSNLGAITYHFGGKLGLYREVLRHRLAVAREQRIGSIRQALAEDGARPDLERILHAFASAFLEPLIKEKRGPRLIELWAREMLDPQLPPETFDVEIVGPVRKVLAEAIAVASPPLPPAAARRCVNSIIAQLVQAAQRVRWAILTKAADRGTDSVEEIVWHIVRFSAGGIRALGAKKVPATAGSRGAYQASRGRGMPAPGKES